MKVSISIDNNSKIIVLPFVPADGLEISYGDSPNENKDSVKYGSIKTMGPEPPASVRINSFFPNGRYPWMEADAFADPMEYVRFFRNNRKKRKPMRVVITQEDGTEVYNRLSACETFNITRITKAGDRFYDMLLEQYRIVK